MIQERCQLVVADNSGARRIRCFRILGGTRRRYASLGDLIVASVQTALPTAAIKKGEIVKAVIVRTHKEVQRRDGSIVRFDDNAAVIVDDNGEPRATRIFGPVARELREKNYMKILSLAPEIV